MTGKAYIFAQDIAVALLVLLSYKSISPRPLRQCVFISIGYFIFSRFTNSTIAWYNRLILAVNSLSIRPVHRVWHFWAFLRYAQSRSIRSRFTKEPKVRRRNDCKWWWKWKCAHCLCRWRVSRFLGLSDDILVAKNIYLYNFYQAAYVHRSASALNVRNVCNKRV